MSKIVGLDGGTPAGMSEMGMIVRAAEENVGTGSGPLRPLPSRPTRLTSRAELAAADRAGHCSHPVRLVTSGNGRDEVILVACRTRRERLCPACSDRYRGDAFQIVAAGMRGGKGVPETVASHPMVFLTATAPGFGPVHAARRDGSPCRPRRLRPACPHGRRLYCFEVHLREDAAVGSPLCPDCFDYEGAVIFNASVTELWQRALLAAYRALASEVGMTEKQLRQVVRISYQKVCEFQKRGLVHIHAAVRLDAAVPPPSPPPEPFDAAMLANCLGKGLARARLLYPALPGRSGELLTFGGASGTSVVELRVSSAAAERISAYIGKYAVKQVADGLECRITSAHQIGKLALPAHLRTMVETAWRLGGVAVLRDLGLRRWAHQLGHAGHVLTKSRHWSTTFGALQLARRRWRAVHLDDGDRTPMEDDVWRFCGIGYDSPSTAELARALAELDRNRRAIKSQRRACTGESDEPGSQATDDSDGSAA